MSALQLIQEATARDIRLWADGGGLVVEAPRGAFTPELCQSLKVHKLEILFALTRKPRSVDWNQTPDTTAADTPFNRRALDAIKAGYAVRVWSSVLKEWLLCVRDEDAKQQLLTEGCTLAIYTLGELAVVAGMDVQVLKNMHAIKKGFGATVGKP